MDRAPQPGVVYLDTHVVCWLYQGRGDLLSAPAFQAIEASRILVSPIVDLELQYLFEVARITRDSATVLSALHEEIGLTVGIEDFASVVRQARTLRWTRDPFDRLIVAEALLSGSPLVTGDQTIREHCRSVIW